MKADNRGKSENILERYKIAFKKFLDSEGGEICVNCKTYGEALYGLQELMKMVNYEKYHVLAYHVQDKVYYWYIHREDTVFYINRNGSCFGNITHARLKKKKVFSYEGFSKRMKYFLYIEPHITESHKE